MRAKFKVNMIEDYGQHQKTVNLSAVTDDDTEENRRFNAATPSASLKIVITNPSAMNFLEVEKCYYLDFSKAEQ